jgi:hypothetical protein
VSPNFLSRLYGEDGTASGGTENVNIDPMGIGSGQKAKDDRWVGETPE